MDIYLVGGAVRDALLDLPVDERDWVVVGATPADMEALGYRLVGKDFPVFLHPDTSDEYALARTERKAGTGHRGFSIDADPSVTLEQDLQRRDLTVNAMAQADDGTLIDPYGGRDDLAGRVLRHVSEAFVEDPLRVLRVARFAARFAHLGFSIAPETLALMTDISNSGELTTLSAERLWSETERALATDSPQVYLAVLRDCNAAAVLLPELGDLEQSGRLLQQAAAANRDSEVRFAALATGLEGAAVAALCQRLHAPRRYAELATLWAEYGDAMPAPESLDAPGQLAVLERTDALRRPERFDQLLAVLTALGGTQHAVEFWNRALAACREVDAAAIAASGIPGHEIGARVRAAREENLAALN